MKFLDKSKKDLKNNCYWACDDAFTLLKYIILENTFKNRNLFNLNRYM